MLQVSLNKERINGGSRGSVVSIATVLRVPIGATEFSLLRNMYPCSGAHPASAPDFIPGGKRSDREANHLPPCSAEVTNEWSSTSAIPVSLHDVDKENCTLI
jgi:hypothetical protein